MDIAEEKNKMKNLINGALQNCEIKDNWPQYESFYKPINKLGDITLKYKHKWVTISDIFNIFYEFVYEAIKPKIDYKNKIDLNNKLSNILSENELNRIESSLINFIISIPRNYKVLIPITKIPEEITKNAEFPNEIVIDNTHSFVIFKNEEEIPKKYRKEGLLKFTSNININTIYFKEKTSGYCSERDNNQTINSVYNNYKIIIEQGLSKEILEINKKHTTLGTFLIMKHQANAHKICFIDEDNNDAEIKTRIISSDDCFLIDSIYFNLGKYKNLKSISKTDKEIFKENFNIPIKFILSDTKESKRIKTASKWCFDSYSTKNKTLSFLQVCFGLEALFSDESKNLPITETLSDRCSYLLSKDIIKRKKLKKDLVELYEIRSKLVHGKENELNIKEKGLLEWGRTILQYAIAKEIEYLNL